MTLSILGLADSQRDGMTIAELEAFLERARSVGAAGTDHVRATVSLRGRVKTIRLVPAEQR